VSDTFGAEVAQMDGASTAGNVTAVRPAVSWLFNVVALYLASLAFGGIDYDEWWVLLIAGAVLALANMVLRPIVIVLTLPAVLLTLGLALFLINALMLWLTGLIVPPFEVSGFWTTLGGAALIWAVNAVLHAVFRGERARALAH
jgi:putative membrane protein